MLYLRCLFRRAAWLAAFLSVAVPVAARAQLASASDPASELRRAQERIHVQRLQAEKSVDVQGSATLRSTDRLPGNESPCFAIQRLESEFADSAGRPFTGAAAPAFDGMAAAAAGPGGDDSPLGKCLGDRGLALVLKRLQEHVLARGFVTTRVLARAQDLSTGSLVVTVLPGFVNAIRYQEADAPGVRLGNNLPLRSGDILNLRGIEQGLENLQRVPTVDADIQIAPAPDPAPLNASDLVIAYRQSAPARVSLTADDSGSQGTGKYQGSATLSLDSPLKLSDLFYITATHDLGGGDAGPRGTRGHTVHYSLPLDYWTLGATHSGSRYFQNVVGRTQEYVYSGTSENTEISLSRLVYRDAVRKTGLSLKAWQRRSNNFIDDAEVQVQRRVVGGWALGLDHKDAVAGSSLETALYYKRGTGDFDAIAAPEEAFNEGSSKFGLLTLDLRAAVPFQAAGYRLRYNAALHVQDNTTPLTPQDRMAIGGRYSVRGLDGESSLAGDRGWTLHNDWSVALGESGQEAYLGIDAGEVGGSPRAAPLGSSLSGGVIGARGNYKKVRYDFFIGAPLDKPASFKSADTTAGFALTLSL